MEIQTIWNNQNKITQTRAKLEDLTYLVSRLTLKLQYSGQINLKRYNHQHHRIIEIDPPMNGLDFRQGCQDNSMEKGKLFQQMVIGQLTIHIFLKKSSLFHTTDKI